MFLTAISVLFILAWNTAVLWLTLGTLSHAILDFMKMPMAYSTIGIFAFGIVLLFALLGMSPLGLWVLRLPLAIRSPVARESNKLQPILKAALTKIEKKHQRTLRYQLMISDQPLQNILVLGKTIVLSRGLLETVNDDELMAAMVAALGHRYYRDSWFYAFTFGANLCGNTIQRILKGISHIIIQVGYRFVILLPIGWIGSCLAYLIKGMDYLLKILMNANMRKRIYRADHFSSELGYGTSLIAYLEKLSNIECRQNGFAKKFLENLPPVMQRIDQLEEAQHSIPT